MHIHIVRIYMYKILRLRGTYCPYLCESTLCTLSIHCAYVRIVIVVVVDVVVVVVVVVVFVVFVFVFVVVVVVVVIP